MKPGLNLILGTVLFSSFGLRVRADDSICFMLDANGDRLNLGSLCQNYAPQSEPSNYQKPPVSRENYYQVPGNYQRKKGLYSVPIKSRRGGIPVIDVKFNDRHVFEMMLDTGALISMTVIFDFVEC